VSSLDRQQIQHCCNASQPLSCCSDVLVMPHHARLCTAHVRGFKGPGWNVHCGGRSCGLGRKCRSILHAPKPTNSRRWCGDAPPHPPQQKGRGGWGVTGWRPLLLLSPEPDCFLYITILPVASSFIVQKQQTNPVGRFVVFARSLVVWARSQNSTHRAQLGKCCTSHCHWATT
jgi:hypothetical protein